MDKKERGVRMVAPQSKNKQLKKEVFYNMKHIYKNGKLQKRLHEKC